jgi:hypothetical protein
MRMREAAMEAAGKRYRKDTRAMYQIAPDIKPIVERWLGEQQIPVVRESFWDAFFADEWVYVSPRLGKLLDRLLSDYADVDGVWYTRVDANPRRVAPPRGWD